MGLVWTHAYFGIPYNVAENVMIVNANVSAHASSADNITVYASSEQSHSMFSEAVFNLSVHMTINQHLRCVEQ